MPEPTPESPPKETVPGDQGPLLATILHLSDLHMGRCFDRDLGDAVIAAAKEHAPDVIVVSGDLVNNPFPRSFRAAVGYLRRLRDACPKAKMVVVPGNHDLKLFGSIPWLGTRGNFEIYFGEFGLRDWADDGCPLRRITVWKRKARLAKEAVVRLWKRIGALPSAATPTVRAHTLAGGHVLVVNYDSNSVIWNARGKVRPGQLIGTDAAVREQLPRLDPLALRIAVLHHHPLPIPYADKSTLTNQEHFLVLNNAGTFLREMAARDFDLVLHGHKHYSHFARINYQGQAQLRTEIGVLAAGSATIRGGNACGANSLNLIRFYAHGRTQVELREFGAGRVFHRPAHTPEPFELHTETGLLDRTGRRNRSVHPVWATRHSLQVQILEGGDCMSRCQIFGLRSEDQPLKGYEIRFESSAGFYSRKSVTVETVGMSLEEERVNNERKKDAQGNEEDFDTYLARMRAFKDRLDFGSARGRLDRPLNFGFEWDAVSGFAMSETEYNLLYKQDNRTLDGQFITVPQESVAEYVVIPVDQLHLEVRLPRQLDVSLGASVHPITGFDARKVIQDGWIIRPQPKIGLADPFLSDIAARSLRVEIDGDDKEQVWHLTLDNPPVGFCYLLTWNLPRLRKTGPYDELRGPALAARAELARLGKDLTQTAHIDAVLTRFLNALRNQYNSGYADEEMDLALFTFDAVDHSMIAVGAMSLPAPKIPPNPAELPAFRPPVGVSTAGQAFKTGRMVVYERLNQHQPFSPFLPFGPKHEVLISAPIHLQRNDIDPNMLSSMERTDAVIGVLTVGSTNAGSNLRKLTQDVLELAGQALVRQIWLETGAVVPSKR